MAQLNITLDTEVLHGLFTKNSKDEAFSSLLEAIQNQAQIVQSSEELSVISYECSEDCTTYLNGYRARYMTKFIISCAQSF